MLGVILTSIGTLFAEAGDLIGKAQARVGRENAYAMGFFTHFWAALIFLGIVLFQFKFEFSWASLPTFGPRVILEILQAHFTVAAIIRADRSTFGFIRVLTMPLLLVTDLVLGYAISQRQIVGIAIIALILIFIFLSDKMGRTGRWLVLFTAINAVVTTSLFKYNITHFNSVVAEQTLIIIIILLYFWGSGFYFHGQNSLRLMFSNRVFVMQSAVQGLAFLAESFAYPFAPASIIMAAKRSSATTWSMLSGQFVFSEKNFLFKITVLAALIGGILLLAL